MTNPYSEDTLVERPAIALFGQLGWGTANCFDEVFGVVGRDVPPERLYGDAATAGPGRPYLGRETPAEVVLRPRLAAALADLNPDLPPEALALAVEELCRDRSALSPVAANREIYDLLRDGVKVTTPPRAGRAGDSADHASRITHLAEGSPRDMGGGHAGDEETFTVRVIDWDHPDRNDFFLASQFWITGEIYKRRADLVGFVNGLPLVFIELKASHKRLEHAFRDNLRDYKTAIPQLFPYNALIILSNGSASKIGTLSSHWEHFNDWKKINSEGEQGVVSLETMLRGTCDPARLLDLVENFTLFVEERGGTIKLIAKNHQYLGVNNAFAAVASPPSPAHGRGARGEGRLGVFWHTQGSGKSYSMIFFAQKVLRKLPGNWTFLVVTDRQELDQQIYRNFANVGAVTEPEGRVRASGGEHLRQLLREDHRYVFTLIQKFHAERGETYPELSDRPDIIVMTDEAHRSQYDIFALNMRNALPNAAFIGFTGTPLMAGEEKTRAVFGDYVSIYNFKQSVDDQATVPLYYENRIPELQLTNPDLNADMAAVLEDAELDEAQEARLEREFAREYHLITRADRLDAIAADIAAHFAGRGYAGKAMVVCVDKATAVRMYDKVKAAWAKATGSAGIPPGGLRPHGAARSRSADRRAEDHRHGRGGLAGPERDRGHGRAGAGHPAAPAAHGEGRFGDEVQGPGRSIPPGLRLRHVDDRVRRAGLLDDLSGQADAQPHPDADHRPRQPRLRRQGQRADRGLHRRLPKLTAGAGDLRLGRGRRALRRATCPCRRRPRWWRSSARPLPRRRATASAWAPIWRRSRPRRTSSGASRGWTTRSRRSSPTTPQSCATCRWPATWPACIAPSCPTRRRISTTRSAPSSRSWPTRSARWRPSRTFPACWARSTICWMSRSSRTATSSVLRRPACGKQGRGSPITCST